MKQLTLFAGAVLFSFSMHAQIEMSNWYFGNHAAMDFSGGCSPTASSGPTTHPEGTSSISDASGNLLILTDGEKVWDKNLNVMPNGTGLLGGSLWHSSTSGSIIVKQPGNNSLYYIFTTGEKENGLVDGFRYTIVDMSLNGGLGEVDASSKNVMINSSSTERIAVCRNATYDGYWIFMHEWGNNKFKAYELTSAGLNTTPATSSIGVIHGNLANGDCNGQMKVNRQETKLAVAINGKNRLQVFNINRATGKLSNQLTFSRSKPIGVAFSANGNVLYSCANETTDTDIHQWDLTASSPAASVTVIATSSANMIADMELAPAPCSKIYIVRAMGNSLDVINSPDVTGTGCGHTNAGYSLASGASCKLGLPTVYQTGTYTCGVDPLFDVNWEYCEAKFNNITSTNPATTITGYQWTFGDGTSSSAFQPQHTYMNSANPMFPFNIPGMVQVCLTVSAFDGTNCCVETYCRDVFVDCEQGDCQIQPGYSYVVDAANCSIDFTGFMNASNRQVSSWNWDFGDGTTGVGQNATHVFSKSGTYTVCLETTGQDGFGGCCTGQQCQTITITCP